MNTFQFGPLASKAVVVGAAAVVAATCTFPAEKVSCVNVLVEYTLGVAGRTLTVSVQLGNKAGTVWLDPITNASVALTASGAIQLSLPGGPEKFRVKLASAGGAGADDGVVLTFQGMPAGSAVV